MPSKKKKKIKIESLLYNLQKRRFSSFWLPSFFPRKQVFCMITKSETWLREAMVPYSQSTGSVWKRSPRKSNILIYKLTSKARYLARHKNFLSFFTMSFLFVSQKKFFFQEKKRNKKIITDWFKSYWFFPKGFRPISHLCFSNVIFIFQSGAFEI